MHATEQTRRSPARLARVGDGNDLGHEIEVLERGRAESELVQNAAERPDVTRSIQLRSTGSTMQSPHDHGSRTQALHLRLHGVRKCTFVAPTPLSDSGDM